MSKNDKLRRSLKAASKRRQRRTASLDATSMNAPLVNAPVAPKVDVTGLIVDVVLQHSSDAARVNDHVIVAALRGQLSASKPSTEPAATLYDRLDELCQTHSLDPRDYRSAIQNLITEATNTGAVTITGTEFLRYLELIAS